MRRSAVEKFGRGTSRLTLTALLAAVSWVGAASAQVVIDDFSAPQPRLESREDAAGPGVSSLADDDSILGGRRSIEIRNLEGDDFLAEVAEGAFSFLAGTGTRAEAVITWEGDDDPSPELDATGLLGIDLTAGGTANQLAVEVEQSSRGIELMVEVFTDAENSSRAKRRLAPFPIPRPAVIPFETFVVHQGGGADFRNVGAIVLTVTGSDAGVTLNGFGVLAPTTVSLTATLVDALAPGGDVDMDGAADPGDTLEYTATITSTGDMSALDTTFQVAGDPNANTTFVAGSIMTTPLAIDDAYSATGHVSISVPAGSGVLVNDTDPDGVGPGLTVSNSDMTSVGGGQVAVAADGGFTYASAAGFEGPDTFTYEISDGEGNNDTATVTITVADVIWFVDNSQTAGGNDGRLGNSFATVDEFNAGAADEVDDVIFLYETGSGNYVDGITLLAGQDLFGHGVNLETELNSLGIFLAPFSDPIPTTNVNPTLDTTGGSGNGISLASNHTIRGLDIGNTTGGTGISGSNVGNLTISDVAISGAGGLIDVTGGGTLDVTFDSLASTSSTTGINLSAVGGSLTVTNPGAGTDTSIAGATNGISIASSVSGASFSFGETTVSAGAGIDLSTNSGSSITFDTLGATSSAGTALAADNSGTVNIGGTANTLDATGGAAADIANTNLGAGWTFFSANAASAVNGIKLATVTGSFEVTGDGASDPANTTRGRTTAKAGGGTLTLGSGGTIANSTGDAVLLTGTNTISLRNMVLSNNGAGSRDGVHLFASSGLTLDNTRITGFSDNGIDITNVNGFTAQHVEIESNAKSANSVAADEANLKAANLFGTALVQNSLIRDAFQDNVRISSCESAACGGASLDITFANVSVRDTLSGPGGNDGILIRSFNDGNVDLVVTGSEFLGNRANGVQHNTNDAATVGSTTVTGSTFDRNAVGINVGHQGTGTHTFSLLTNTMNQANGTPANAGSAINIFLAGLSSGTSVLSGTISGNTIGNAADTDSGGDGDGINLFASGAGALTARVDNNTVRAMKFGNGVNAVSSSHTGTLNLTMRGNDLDVNPSSNFPLAGVSLGFSGLAADSSTMCADLEGSGGAPPGGDENVAFIGDAFFFGAFVNAGSGGAQTLELVGYTGANNDSAAIAAFLGGTAITVSPGADASTLPNTATGRVAPCPQP